MSNYYLTNDELTHWGIKGQKWGVRRYQNEDGSLTPAGKERYGYTGKVKKIGQKESAEDRRKRIKAEGAAILNSKTSHKEKAKALSKLGDHNSSAEEYAKDFRNKRNAMVIGNAAYRVGALVASHLLNGQVQAGKMTVDQAKNIGNAFNIGKNAVNAYLTASMISDIKKYNKEYWRF